MACDAILFVSRLIEKYSGKNCYTYSEMFGHYTYAFALIGYISTARVNNACKCSGRFLRHPV